MYLVSIYVSVNIVAMVTAPVILRVYIDEITTEMESLLSN